MVRDKGHLLGPGYTRGGGWWVYSPDGTRMFSRTEKSESKTPSPAYCRDVILILPTLHFPPAFGALQVKTPTWQLQRPWQHRSHAGGRRRACARLVCLLGSVVLQTAGIKVLMVFSVLARRLRRWENGRQSAFVISFAAVYLLQLRPP